jgi:hypothetical protein
MEPITVNTCAGTRSPHAAAAVPSVCGTRLRSAALVEGFGNHGRPRCARHAWLSVSSLPPGRREHPRAQGRPAPLEPRTRRAWASGGRSGSPHTAAGGAGRGSHSHGGLPPPRSPHDAGAGCAHGQGWVHRRPPAWSEACAQPCASLETPPPPAYVSTCPPHATEAMIVHLCKSETTPASTRGGAGTRLPLSAGVPRRARRDRRGACTEDPE